LISSATMLYVAAASFIGSTAFTAGSALPASRFLMQQPAVRMAEANPVLIGIAADSGCGKSTFMRRNNVTTSLELKACFATRRSEGDVASEYVELAQGLSIVGEPQAGTIYVEHAEVTSLSFAADGVAQQGDMVVVQPLEAGCGSVLATAEAFPEGPSPVMILEAGATVGLMGVLNARLNELEVGAYILCLATAESKGNDAGDFHTLLGQLVVQAQRVHPTLRMPATVGLGQDVLVHWTAGSGRAAHSQDWIGLFAYGECPQVNLVEDMSASEALDPTAPVNQNQCYLASEMLPAGQEAGTLRFSPAQYGLKQGTFEARYFLGDSRDGQGVVCRRLRDFEDALFQYCALEHAAVSNPLEVLVSIADGSYEYTHQEDAMPGLDLVMHEGTYQMA